MQKCAEELLSEFRARSETVSFAESCTGGLLSAVLTEIPGVSEVYLGTVVSYAYPAKVDLLSVDLGVLVQQGAVSPEVAAQMAQGARSVFKSTWSASITGIAGPGGATPTKPVGTVCFAISGKNGVITDLQQFSGDRAQVREASVLHVFSWLLTVIRN